MKKNALTHRVPCNVVPAHSDFVELNRWSHLISLMLPPARLQTEGPRKLHVSNCFCVNNSASYFCDPGPICDRIPLHQQSLSCELPRKASTLLTLSPLVNRFTARFFEESRAGRLGPFNVNDSELPQTSHYHGHMFWITRCSIVLRPLPGLYKVLYLGQSGRFGLQHMIIVQSL